MYGCMVFGVFWPVLCCISLISGNLSLFLLWIFFYKNTRKCLRKSNTISQHSKLQNEEFYSKLTTIASKWLRLFDHRQFYTMKHHMHFTVDAFVVKNHLKTRKEWEVSNRRNNNQYNTCNIIYCTYTLPIYPSMIDGW